MNNHCNLLKISLWVFIGSISSVTIVFTIIIFFILKITNSIIVGLSTIPFILIFCICEYYSYWLLKELEIENHSNLNDSFIIYREHKKKCKG